MNDLERARCGLALSSENSAHAPSLFIAESTYLPANAADERVFDLAFNRIPRASFRRALESKGIRIDSQHDGFAKPVMVNVLFCRDLIDETDAPNNYHIPCKPFTFDQLIKMMSSMSARAQRYRRGHGRALCRAFGFAF